jgi:cardiolipin synthase (CMP-forming)
MGSTRTLTPANQITILRLVFVPLFAILEIDRHYHWALAALIVAALSDGVDGIVARVFHQESPLGVALDPIADKVFMATAYLILAFKHGLPWWITILVLSRDVSMVITALLISLIEGYRPFRPTILGKASTVFQMATIFAAVGMQAHFPGINRVVVLACVYLTAAFTLSSGVHYLIVARKRFGGHSSEPEAEGPASKAE